MSNIQYMGQPFSFICQEDSVSTFSHSMSADYSHIPASLRPTVLQRNITHHPWIDVIPSPQFRDNILQASLEWLDDPKETELCEDITGVGALQVSCIRPGMLVWGDSWDSYHWEVTEEFATKWSGLLKNCHDIIESTNHWRSARGEDNIKWEDSCPNLINP
ncbi:hypothetical protein F5884DRAFT_380813 [Xylogone sp. PMI_703]|nr:hypothetical protein F5884DRAFT_380813 [Xylogone sp. PMI_703]